MIQMTPVFQETRPVAPPKQRVLVVDDEQPIVESLVYSLRKEGFDVSSAPNGLDAWQRIQAQPPDVVLLDVMLPGMDGFNVCRLLRSNPKSQHVRVMMLTARGEETDEIVGFNLGADDYVSKPFRMRPLIERVKALLRRPTEEKGAEDIVKVGELQIDRTNHLCRIGDEEIPLTLTEFRLLWTMARRPGRTFSRNELLDCCRGEDNHSMERTIDVHVRALRKKLGDTSEIVETVRGIGYRCRLK